MKLSEIKAVLPTLDKLSVRIDDQSSLPAHFHVTEVGMVSKKFIDCGGVVRSEEKISFQLWTADDVDHRLAPGKLLSILSIAEDKIGLQDLEIEVEYQGSTIETYHLELEGKSFVLKNKSTACLAEDQCMVEKPKVKIADIQNSCCNPGTCC
jgi:hypothetical protein